MKVNFQYPVFTATGKELFLQVEAEVQLSRPPLIVRGEVEDDGLDEEAMIIDTMFLAKDVLKAISPASWPDEMLAEMEEIAIEVAKQKIQDQYEYEYEAAEVIQSY